MGVLKHFVEECVGSIQLVGIRAFWSIRAFWPKESQIKSIKIFELY